MPVPHIRWAETTSSQKLGSYPLLDKLAPVGLEFDNTGNEQIDNLADEQIDNLADEQIACP